MANVVKRNQTAEVKTKTGSNYSYKYVDIAQIHEYLESIGASYYQYIDRIDGDDYIMTIKVIDGKESQPLRGSRVVDATLFGNDNPAQKQGSALTYARRYSLLMAFGLATEDNDANDLNILKEATQEDAVKWTFSFGKYNGKKMLDVLQEDEQYVQWFINNKASEYDKKCYEILTGVKLPTDEELDARVKLISEINELERKTDTDHEDMLEYFKVESLAQMTDIQLTECKKVLEKKLKKEGK